MMEDYSFSWWDLEIIAAYGDDRKFRRCYRKTYWYGVKHHRILVEDMAKKITGKRYDDMLKVEQKAFDLARDHVEEYLSSLRIWFK